MPVEGPFQEWCCSMAAYGLRSVSAAANRRQRYHACGLVTGQGPGTWLHHLLDPLANHARLLPAPSSLPLRAQRP
jgi:hypothetical protein